MFCEITQSSVSVHCQNSLMSTIINLAQNFVGSNNINLLMPIGQFGTRLHGGKDASSPRYIFTMLRWAPSTVKAAYKESANKKLSIIRN